MRLLDKAFYIVRYNTFYINEISFFSVLVSATCDPPNSYFKQYTDRYYVSTLGVYNKRFIDAITSFTIVGAHLAIISDKNSHDAVYANRGIQNTAKNI